MDGWGGKAEIVNLKKREMQKWSHNRTVKDSWPLEDSTLPLFLSNHLSYDPSFDIRERKMTLSLN